MGENSNLAQDWKIEYFPTICVVDAKCVIRHNGLIGKELEETVAKLLRKMGN